LSYVSRFTTFTYAGILIGPAAIGGISQLVGLTSTLAALIPMLAFVVLASRLPSTCSLRELDPHVA